MPDLALQLAALLPQSGTPYIVMVLCGFAIGIVGHLSSSRWLVALGVALIFLGAFVFPLALNLTEGTPPEVRNQR